MAWLGLAWLGLAWPGLAWPGLAWPGLAWKLSSTRLSGEAAKNRLVSGQTALTALRGLRVAYVCGSVVPGHWFIYTHMYLFQKCHSF